ncbi:MAG: hypothetical protein AB7U75_19925 [Hyphomicrobiaceae bacterium]
MNLHRPAAGLRDPTRQLIALHAFDLPHTYGSPRVVALRLANATPKTKPTRFFVLDLEVALRWNDQCGGGSFMYAVPQKGVAHRYWFTDPKTGEKTNKFILLSRFASNASAHTYCKHKNGNRFDIRACNVLTFEHPRGSPLTAAEQIEEKASREDGKAPRVPLVASLVPFDRCDWSDWSVKDAWTVKP